MVNSLYAELSVFGALHIALVIIFFRIHYAVEEPFFGQLIWSIGIALGSFGH